MNQPSPHTTHHGAHHVHQHQHDKPVGWVSTQGIRPRLFGLEPSGQRLFATNEVREETMTPTRRELGAFVFA
ncbi:lactonase family protein [Streptomyces albicerus]|uniref:lactonase family protein n=1 Tax=Streptomyces albicerus TaxID=2569859 RepID=UPI00124B9AB6|nr:lactonase family protein [Streptomyces albicerus]